MQHVTHHSLMINHATHAKGFDVVEACDVERAAVGDDGDVDGGCNASDLFTLLLSHGLPRPLRPRHKAYGHDNEYAHLVS